MTYVQPRLPVDLNRGYEQFRDRDRFNPYPAPLEPISESLRLSNQLDEVTKADFVTWRCVSSLSWKGWEKPVSRLHTVPARARPLLSLHGTSGVFN